MSEFGAPGVYRREVLDARAPALATGVPAFAGFASALQGGPPPEQPVQLRRAVDLPRLVNAWSGGFLAAAVDGFFANGGVQCYVVGADPESPDRVASLLRTLDAIGRLGEVDLVAVPDAAVLGADDAHTVQRAAIALCARQGDRVAILDAGRGARPVDVGTLRDALAAGLGTDSLAAGTLYYPWVRVRDASGTLVAVPPCGHVAGVYARTDARVGVFKAPANEELAGVIDLDWLVDDATQAELFPSGVNCLRALPGRGIRVFGARTMSRDPSSAQVNVRRLILTLRRWIGLNMAWAAFEPNATRLWVRIRRELTVHLSRLWQDGALAGATPAQAFYVKCDAETNPPEGRENGAVVTEIGIAPSVPAEFVVVRIVHREASDAAA